MQATCDAAAAKPPGELGRRIAQTAIDEFNHFGGHQIDANGRLFRFGLTEAEHDEDDAGVPQAQLGQLGWWQVMKYWRSLFGTDAPPTSSRCAAIATPRPRPGGAGAALLRTSAGELLRAADEVADPEEREILREAALRGAILDTSWSAAFISYVVQAGGRRRRTRSASPTRTASISTTRSRPAWPSRPTTAGDRLYRACPLATTRPRPGDLICQQRETALADASDAAVRERIREELAGGSDTRSIRRTHCERGRACRCGRAQGLHHRRQRQSGRHRAEAEPARRGLTFSAAQKGHCGGAGHWTLPQPAGQPPQRRPAKCSLNDRKWFVLLQVR